MIVALLFSIVMVSFAPAPVPVPDPAALARALASLPARPTAAAVQDAALRRATLSPRTAERWLRRARAAAILPGVTAEYGLRSDQGWQLDQAAVDGDELSHDLGAGRVVQVRATWDLDRLIFNADELRAARANLDLAEVRERLLVRVTQLYFERQQLLLEIASLPARDGHEAIGRHVRLAEVEAVLAGLTGLRFTRGSPGPP